MKRKQKYDTPLRIICALLFATFAFLYIYLVQGELLALVQDHLSQGQTTNNTLITASLITLLLMVLQYLLNKMGKLHGRYEIFSYLPSCVLLALVTKIDETFSYSWSLWGMAMLVVFVLYLIIVWIDRNTLQLRDTKFLQMLIPNLVGMVAMFVFTGWYGNNEPAATMELAAWKYTHSGEYDKVLKVGKQSEDYNVRLTALRNLALAKTGELGDKLFAYPQPYGSDGMLMSRYNVQTPEYGSQEYYQVLGSIPYGGENATAFYKRMLQKTDSVYYRNLYAAALLLDKDLEDFASLTVDQAHASDTLSGAPTHYQEAWVIYNEQHPFAPITFALDSAVQDRYQAYLALRESHADDAVAMRNLCQRQFGDTYWYYYDFVNPQE